MITVILDILIGVGLRFILGVAFTLFVAYYIGVYAEW